MKRVLYIFVLLLMFSSCASFKNNATADNASSPFVGKWMWQPKGEKGISCLYIGERNDSLLISVYGKFRYAWLFVPYEGADGTMQADISLPMPDGKKVEGVYSHSPVGSNSEPRYKKVSLKLRNENTLVWNVELNDDINIPDHMVFKRESHKNYSFFKKPNFVYKGVK
jgi:hypothetical protein